MRPNEMVQIETDQEGHMKKLMLLLAVVAVAAMPSAADAAKKKAKVAAPPPPPEATVPVIGPILEGFTKLPRMAINDLKKY
jgi:hypothetical protein